MGARLRSWLQKISSHSEGILFGIFLLGAITLFVIIICAYLFNWYWTGFVPTITPTVILKGTYNPGKTLWDWMALIFASIVTTLVAYITIANSIRQKEVDLLIASDKQREDALQAYIDKISELLLKEHLGERTADGQLKSEYKRVCLVARVRTITVLTQLDARRIGYIFAFLREAELMSVTKDDNAISLKNADLHAVDWSQADLCGADLRGAKITDEQLAKAASLEGATMPVGTKHD